MTVVSQAVVPVGTFSESGCVSKTQSFLTPVRSSETSKFSDNFFLENALFVLAELLCARAER